MNTFTVAGPTALLKWGYREVAQLSSWVIGVNGVVTATVTSMDAVGVTQAPLTFVVARPTQAWVWTVKDLQIAGTSFTATLAQE